MGSRHRWEVRESNGFGIRWGDGQMWVIIAAEAGKAFAVQHTALFLRKFGGFWASVWFRCEPVVYHILDHLGVRSFWSIVPGFVKESSFFSVLAWWMCCFLWSIIFSCSALFSSLTLVWSVAVCLALLNPFFCWNWGQQHASSSSRFLLSQLCPIQMSFLFYLFKWY